MRSLPFCSVIGVCTESILVQPFQHLCGLWTPVDPQGEYCFLGNTEVLFAFFYRVDVHTNGSEAAVGKNRWCLNTV